MTQPDPALGVMLHTNRSIIAAEWRASVEFLYYASYSR